MNETNSTPTKKRFGRRWILAAVLTVAVGASGAAAAIAGGGFGMHHGGMGHHGKIDPANAAKHIDKMVEHILADGTPQQKARLSEIAKAAFADLMPVHAQFRDAHKRAHELLMAPSIDRVALEALRAEQMQRADAMSKRVLAAVADAAEVLTPAQRVRFAEHMKKRMHR
ncbi:MAG: Spy/CpxP family protein refolding chaperone [Pseudomonadota bacterium]